MSSPVTGDDVIGVDGQKLTRLELRVLVGLADGETPSEIAKAVGTDRIGLRHLEGNIQGKLGAKTKPHMIARGFVLGVLLPRALCLVLCLSMASAIEQPLYRTGRMNSRTTASRTLRLRRELEI